MRVHPIATVIALIVFVMALDRGVSLALDLASRSSDYRLSRLYAGKIDADVVVFGSSRAIHMIDPQAVSKEAGARVYDLGLNHIDMRTEEIFIHDYLAHNPKPKLVVLEASNLNWSQSVAAEYAAYSDESPDLARELDSESRSILPYRHIFHSYAYNGDLIWRVLAFIGRNDEQAKAPLNSQITPAVKAAFNQRHWAFDADRQELDVSKRTVKFLESQGVRVELVIAPFNQEVMGPWHERYLAALSAAFPGYIIRDYSVILPGDAGFSDPLHLNAAGRTALRPMLVSLIDKDLYRERVAILPPVSVCYSSNNGAGRENGARGAGAPLTLAVCS